jgi:hypothetical protein
MADVIKRFGPPGFDSLGSVDARDPANHRVAVGGHPGLVGTVARQGVRGRGSGRHLACPLLVAVAAATLAACGQASGPTTRPPVTASPTTTPSASLDPTTAAILQAYQNEEAAWQSAASSADPTSPSLAATMINPLLLNAKKELYINEQDGIVLRGAYRLGHPHVVSVNGTGVGATALLRDCLYDTTLEVYVKTGQPVPNQPGGTQPQYDGMQVTFTEIAPGEWKASAEQEDMGKCPAGY